MITLDFFRLVAEHLYRDETVEVRVATTSDTVHLLAKAEMDPISNLLPLKKKQNEVNNKCSDANNNNNNG